MLLFSPRQFVQRLLPFLLNSVILLIICDKCVSAESNPKRPFNAFLEKYVNSKSLVFVSTCENNSSYNGLEISEYFVAASKPNYLLIEEKYTYPRRKTSCVRRFISDGSNSYETNSLYPEQYICRPIPSTPNILADLLIQYHKAPLSATLGAPVALQIFSLDQPRKWNLWNQDWEGSRPKLVNNGIRTVGFRYNISNFGSLGDIYCLDQFYYLDTNNIFYLLEHNEYFEQENITKTQKYSQVEFDRNIPLSLFRFAKNKNCLQVKSFS